MAKKPDPLIELTAEARKRIEDLQSDIDASQRAINGFEELGMDVSKLQERVDWAKKAREIVLRELT